MVLGPGMTAMGHVLRDQRSRIRIAAEERGHHDRFLDEVKGEAFKADIMPVTAINIRNNFWKLLAGLLKQLPALMDLIYRFPGQFPPCLLETLHKHLPRCKLHINTFRLRSLNAPSIDPYEFRLATSPSLYSIRVDCDMQYGRITEKVQNFNFEAVQSMVSGMAPNLKEVHVFHAGYNAIIEDYLPGKPWKGFTHNEPVQNPQSILGSLRCLEIEEVSLRLVAFGET
jgi:hypothetical protein